MTTLSFSLKFHLWRKKHELKIKKKERITGVLSSIHTTVKKGEDSWEETQKPNPSSAVRIWRLESVETYRDDPNVQKEANQQMKPPVWWCCYYKQDVHSYWLQITSQLYFCFSTFASSHTKGVIICVVERTEVIESNWNWNDFSESFTFWL